MKNSEQRRVPCHRGKLPKTHKRSESITRDFNISGIYFESDRSFSVGQSIEFSIATKYADPDHPVRMNCAGEMVRVEETCNKVGVVASINS